MSRYIDADDIDNITVFLDSKGCLKRIEAPTADVAPVVHGSWVLVDDYGKPFLDPIYECSICKKPTTIPRSEKFCYNCGAKMDEE